MTTCLCKKTYATFYAPFLHQIVSDTSTCKTTVTTGYKTCKFPFEFQGKQYYDCPYETLEDDADYDMDGSDSRWCPLNNEMDKNGYFKATGLCSESCPGSKAYLQNDFYF